VNFIKKLKDTEGITVKKIRCDNAGENKAFQNRAEQARLGLKFEYTARKTPQHNGRVERKYATLFGRACAMMNDAGFVEENIDLRRGLWAEAVGTATKIENVVASANKAEPVHNAFYEKEATYVRHLQTFGKCGVVHDAKTIKNKLDSRGEMCIFVGYADDHAGNVYHMFNPQMKQIWVTRDVRWIKLSPTLDEKTPVETVPTVETVLDEYDDDEGIVPSDHGAPAVVKNTPMAAAINATTTANTRQGHACVLREMKKLGGWFNRRCSNILRKTTKMENLK